MMRNVQILLVRFRNGDSLPFSVPDEFTLDDAPGEWMSSGGFLKLPDGKELWCNPQDFLSAFLIPNAHGQTIGMQAPVQGFRL